MKGNFDSQRSPQFFTKLILSVINILSGIYCWESLLSPLHFFFFIELISPESIFCLVLVIYYDNWSCCCPGVSLLISSSSCSDDVNFSGPCGTGHASEGPSAADNRGTWNFHFGIFANISLSPSLPPSYVYTYPACNGHNLEWNEKYILSLNLQWKVMRFCPSVPP